MATFQSEVIQPLKDKANPFFKSKYVPLENVVEAITNTAPKHGLSFVQYPVSQDNKVGIVTILMHSSGEYIETEPVFANPAKQDAQATGSVITYLKRYSLSAVFGITSDEDDDGNQATFGSNKPNTKPANQGNSKALLIKQLGEKVAAISKQTGVEARTVYQNAIAQFGIKKESKDLTIQEAEKIIQHLATFE